ncbi:MAG: hypothetical protein ACP5O3_03905 [Candidatus Micrarchaeia archaeon]
MFGDNAFWEKIGFRSAGPTNLLNIGFGEARFKEGKDEDGYDTKQLTTPDVLTQAMSLLEDFTPIKPVMGKNINGFEDAMMNGTLFGVPHEIIWSLVLAGIAVALINTMV